VTGFRLVHDHLDRLWQDQTADPEHPYALDDHLIHEWMQMFSQPRRCICEVVAAWLVERFANEAIDFEFADGMANDLHHLVVPRDAPLGTGHVLDYHTPFTWEVYLAFDAGEYSASREIDPVEAFTKPLVFEIMSKIRNLVSYPEVLAGLKFGAPAATS